MRFNGPDVESDIAPYNSSQMGAIGNEHNVNAHELAALMHEIHVCDDCRSNTHASGCTDANECSCSKYAAPCLGCGCCGM